MTNQEPVEIVTVSITTGDRETDTLETVTSTDSEGTLEDALICRDVHAAAVHWGTYLPLSAAAASLRNA